MNLYLRNVITEGPDAGYGYAVEPTMKKHDREYFYGRPYSTGMDSYDLEGIERHEQEWSNHLASLPGILVHPSYLETHKVGFLPDDWEEGYDQWWDECWQSCSVETYNSYQPELPNFYRKVILPRTSHEEALDE